MKYDNDKVDFTISGGATRHFTVLHLHYLYCFLNLPFPEPWLVCVLGTTRLCTYRHFSYSINTHSKYSALQWSCSSGGVIAAVIEYSALPVPFGGSGYIMDAELREIGKSGL